MHNKFLWECHGRPQGATLLYMVGVAQQRRIVG